MIDGWPIGIVIVIVVPVKTPSVRVAAFVAPPVTGLSAETVTDNAVVVAPVRLIVTAVVPTADSSTDVGVIATVKSAGAATGVAVTSVAPVRSTMSEFTDDGRVVATTANAALLMADASAFATSPFVAFDATETEI